MHTRLQEYRDISSLVTYGVQRTTISFAATDDGELDEDGVANGIFKDPNGPAIVVGGLSNTGRGVLPIVLGSAVLLAGSTLYIIIRSRRKRR